MEDEGHNKKESLLSVLTLNCWGIPFISKDVKKRFSYIAKELATGKYDVVSLQEVWSQKDYEYICNVVADVLPYTFYFYSGIIGSGVCILSKYPITDTFTYRYSLNGYLHMIHHGDWYGGKSVGYCIIEHPMQRLHFFTTHLHAEYDRMNDKYLAHRAVQAFQLTEFINHLTTSNDCVVVMGDLNSEPVDPCYRAIKDIPGLTDAWFEVNKNKNGYHGYTCDLKTNIYSCHDNKQDGKRIDYILYRSPGNCLRCLNCSVTMGQIPGENLPYSDHEGVMATFQLLKQDEKELIPIKGKEVNAKKEALLEVAGIIHDGMENTQTKRLSIFMTILPILLFIFLPCLAFRPFFSPSVLHTAQVLSAMFLCVYIYHSVMVKMEERQAYRNTKLELEIQLKQFVT